MFVRSFRKVASLSLMGGLCLLAGCAVPFAAREDAPKAVSADQVYTFSPGDTIRMTVSNDEKLTGDYLIDQRGNITIPILGEVSTVGFSKGQLEEKIYKLFKSTGIYAKPVITLDIIAPRPVSVLGQVKSPGTFPYRPSMTVMKAIAQAGGYTPRAAENKILIDRGTGSEAKRLNATESTPLLPGDDIIVRERIF